MTADRPASSDTTVAGLAAARFPAAAAFPPGGGLRFLRVRRAPPGER